MCCQVLQPDVRLWDIKREEVMLGKLYKCIHILDLTSNPLAMVTVVEATSGHLAVKSLRDKKTPLILFIFRYTQWSSYFYSFFF